MLAGRIDHGDAADLGWLQGLFREGHRIFVIFDDVDLFTPQFADDRLHAHTFHAHACANRVNFFVLGHDRDLGALAGFTGDCANHNRAVIDFGNFRLEQVLHQFRRSARDYDAWSVDIGTGPANAASPIANDSRRDCSLRGMRASALPISKITSGPSTRFTVAFTISPTRPMYSL